MLQIRYSIISLHWRKKHILWLSVVTLALLSVQFFLSNISLGEGTYVNTNFAQSLVEIIGLLFILYFWSTTRSMLIQSKILYLFWSKKQNAHSIIWWIVSGLFTIVSVYTIIGYLLITLLGTLPAHYIIALIGTIVVFYIMTLIVVLLSLISNPYITFMGSGIIYGISYSINFIITSIQWQEYSDPITNTLLRIIQAILPHFDLLTSPLIPISNRIYSIIGHGILWIVLYFLIIRVFSSRYTSHEDFLNLWHETKVK